MGDLHPFVIKQATIANQEVEICRTNLLIRPFEARANSKALYSGYVTRDGKTIEFYAKHSYQVVARFDAETFERILDVNDFPAPAPAMAQEESVGASGGSAPTDYEIAYQAVRVAEEEYVREFDNKHPIYYGRALLALNEARRVRAAAGIAEVKARGQYEMHRTSFSDGSASVMRALAALAQLHSECTPDYDVAAADATLRADLPIYTFEAMYRANL